MPGMGGRKCLDELLAIDPTLKILVASGYSADGRIQDTLDHGASAFIAKPFRRNDLLKAVRRLLDQ
jgi:DNA-binding NarL/FixJ family response regulator